MLEREFDYYKKHQEELVTKYNGKYIVIIGEDVVDVYDTLPETYKESGKKYKAGEYLIQLCLPGKENYTQNFYSRRVVFA